MKILNLYACLGGNRYKWNEVKSDIEVTAIELDPELAQMYKERFPNDTVIVADAHQYLLDHYKEFDFIWSSPPCPSHSKMVLATRHEIDIYPDMKLYEEIILLKYKFKGKYCVENVKSYYEPLIQPQEINRHYYWSNFRIPNIQIKPLNNFSKATRNQVATWLGFNYLGNNIYLKGNHCPAQVLRNCIHPNEGRVIFETALGIISKSKTEQTILF
jgi:DNA (cytosine-5)-methyltransferase 1